jgi:hypothetical protein
MKMQLTPEERAEQHAAAIVRRQKEIAEDIAWWRKQEKIRIEGFNIVQSDPMFRRMTEHYNQEK